MRACYFLASVYSLVTRIPAVYQIIVGFGQGCSKGRKDGEILELFVVMDWCLQVTLYLQFYDFELPSRKSKGSRNGERSRIEALLEARCDAEDLADERSTSVAHYETARNKCRRNHDFLQ